MQEEDKKDSYFLRSAKMQATNIDPQKMYQNFHFGLLIRNASAKHSEVLDKVKLLCLDKLDNEDALDTSGGWYPYRVPWITGRILISLKSIDFSEYGNAKRLNGIIEDAIDSLYQRIKVQRLHIFFALLIPDMSYEEKQLLDDALIRTYARKGITHDNTSLNDPDNPSVYREMPVLGDLHDVLKEESDTKRLSNIINRFVHGSASTFNQQTNVNLDNKFTVLDISELSGDLLPIGMFVALDFVWDKAKANRTEEKAIFIDECWQLIGGGSGTFGVGNRLAAEMVLEIFKTIRAYSGSGICATQDLNDFFSLDNGKYGKGIINNCRTKVILNLEDEEAQRVQQVLHLSEAEVMEITHFERGNGLISSNNNNITVEIKASQLERDLITTARRELLDLLRRMKRPEA